MRGGGGGVGQSERERKTRHEASEAAGRWSAALAGSDAN